MTRPTDITDVVQRTMAEAFRSLMSANRPDLLPAQKVLITQFRLIRNGLGNYGRGQETADVALLTSPTITSSNGRHRLHFADPLPIGTDAIVLIHPDGTDRLDRPVLSDGSIPIDRWTYTRVNVVDVRDDVLAVGIPTLAYHQHIDVPDPSGTTGKTES